MENGQLEKRVQWLDEERRAAQSLIEKLEKRVGELEAALAAERKATQPLHKDLARLDVRISKIDDFELQLKDNKKDIQAELKKLDTERKQGLKEVQSAVQTQQKDLERSLKNVEAALSDLPELNKQLKANQRADTIQDEKLAQLAKTLDDLDEGEKQRQKLADTLREDSVKDAKRVAEMRGELAAMLKNAEKAVAKVDLVAEDHRKLEKEMDALESLQQQMQERQRDFVELATLQRTERERQWAEWAQRFDLIEKTSDEMKARLQDLSATDQAVKRAQKAFDELVEKINRRVNELNEIQRLGEQRLRQEWSTFQADSQKRWSNFNLGYEEQRQEGARQRERLTERLVPIEDSLQELQDTVQHLREQLEGYFQNMLEVFRETLSENERFFGGFR